MHVRLSLAALVCLGAAAHAERADLEKVQIKATHVAGTVYVLEGAGGNIGVSVGDDGILIVDDQFAPLAPKIQAALKNISPRPLKFVLNTHWHGDHTGGNEAFGAQAPIIAHDNVRKRLMAGEPNPSGGRPPRPPAPKGALPVITFDDKLSIHVNGEDIRVIHFPKGHTDGDAVIFFATSNVVHLGDDFFCGKFPVIDVKSGGSVRGYVHNIELLIPQIPPGAKLIPGHGPIATIDDLKKFGSMLKDSVALVEGGIRAGKTLDQMKQEKLLARYDAWSWDFIKADDFLGMLYADLAPKK